MFLPNGVHIYFANPSIETFERIQGMMDRGEPIGRAMVHVRIARIMSLAIWVYCALWQKDQAGFPQPHLHRQS